jgi:hypothetical protein
MRPFTLAAHAALRRDVRLGRSVIRHVLNGVSSRAVRRLQHLLGGSYRSELQTIARCQHLPPVAAAMQDPAPLPDVDDVDGELRFAPSGRAVAQGSPCRNLTIDTHHHSRRPDAVDHPPLPRFPAPAGCPAGRSAATSTADRAGAGKETEVFARALRGPRVRRRRHPAERTTLLTPLASSNREGRSRQDRSEYPVAPRSVASAPNVCAVVEAGIRILPDASSTIATSGAPPADEYRDDAGPAAGRGCGADAAGAGLVVATGARLLPRIAAAFAAAPPAPRLRRVSEQVDLLLRSPSARAA